MTYIIKSSGRKERFNPNNISNTVIKAGGQRSLAEWVSKKVSRKIHNGDNSERILNLTLRSLNKYPEIAARYDLKRAIMHLGPSGFPFEKYFARILQEYGYETEVGRVLNGKNITHEVDIIAENVKNKKRFMVECKYHNHRGNYTNSKTVLYVYARFLDLKKFDFPWVATNTHCSRDAMDYAKGVNMKITGWDYPKGESLQEMITQKGLYPITIIREVNQRTKMCLFAAKIMLLKDLLDYDFNSLKRKTGLSNRNLRKVINGAKRIVGLRDD